MYHKNKENAFTLIELAIVIVIIGLIVGGVLGAQSLINSSKRQAVIKDFNTITTAVTAFELEYDGLPGDLVDANDYWPSDICDGDGDGEIDAFGTLPDSSQCPADGATSEKDGFWKSLQMAEILPNLGPSFKCEGRTSGYLFSREGDIPSSPYNGVGYAVMNFNGTYTLNLGVTYGSTVLPKGIHVLLGKPESCSGTANLYSATGIKPADALAIDKKIDDGFPKNKKIQAGRGSSSGCMETDSNATMGYRYDLDDTETNCALTFQVR